MTKSKRGERGSSSSSVSSNTELKKARMNEEEEETNSLRDLIQNLTANMESNFAKLHEELCGLRQEMKEEIDMLKSNIKGVEKSVDEIWATIEDMKEATKALKDSKTVQEDEMQELRALLTKTKAELKEERDKVIELEDYTRRENLKFHNILESDQKKVLTTRRNKLYSQHFAKGVANGHCTNSISRSASKWQAKRKQTQTDHCLLRFPSRQR